MVITRALCGPLEVDGMPYSRSCGAAAAARSRAHQASSASAPDERIADEASQALEQACRGIAEVEIALRRLPQQERPEHRVLDRGNGASQRFSRYASRNAPSGQPSPRPTASPNRAKSAIRGRSSICTDGSTRSAPTMASSSDPRSWVKFSRFPRRTPLLPGALPRGSGGRCRDTLRSARSLFRTIR